MPRRVQSELDSRFRSGLALWSARIAEISWLHGCCCAHACPGHRGHQDRKSTRLNSSHTVISYAVFCLKKKKKIKNRSEKKNTIKYKLTKQDILSQVDAY